jgi:hypothetical protein
MGKSPGEYGTVIMAGRDSQKHLEAMEVVGSTGVVGMVNR